MELPEIYHLFSFHQNKTGGPLVTKSSPFSEMSATVKTFSERYNQQEMETDWMLNFIKFLLILCYNQDITAPPLLTAN